jgi:hypothetical protein
MLQRMDGSLSLAKHSNGEKRMSRWLAGLAAVAILVPSAWIGTADAADQGIRSRVVRERVEPIRDCGCCGCWVPEYVQHRELLYSYPSDPRYTLTSEPHYTLGRIYSYVHNW